MINITYAIDGACRNNGKPNCVSAAGVFEYIDDGIKPTAMLHFTAEDASTNQRGELHGLILALMAMTRRRREAIDPDSLNFRFITDSEYLYNAISKGWYESWPKKFWRNANGDPIKNRDLWERVVDLMRGQDDLPIFYTKGHVISIGEKTAQNLLSEDNSGLKLLSTLYDKYDEAVTMGREEIFNGMLTFSKNNNFAPSTMLFREFTALNMVADVAAKRALIATSY